jgi:hypothetical protein
MLEVEPPLAVYGDQCEKLSSVGLSPNLREPLARWHGVSVDGLDAKCSCTSGAL